MLQFTAQEWAVLDAGIAILDLSPEQVAEAIAIKASFPKLSANDCFCLVTTRCHEGAILLTGDGILRGVALNDGRRVHGVLWVVDELKRLELCGNDVLERALGLWRDDPTARLPAQEVARRLRQMDRT